MKSENILDVIIASGGFDMWRSGEDLLVECYRESENVIWLKADGDWACYRLTLEEMPGSCWPAPVKDY